MEECGGGEFPGFQIISVHKEEYQYVFRRPMSRLQSRAPCPLQLMKSNGSTSLKCKGVSESSSAASSSNSSSSSFISCYNQTKDPIPLLSPLVLPSLLDSSFIQEGNTNTAKSH